MPKGRLNVGKSMRLFSQALKVMPGGTSSNARLWKTAQFCPIYTPCTIFAKRAYGSHIWDVDGNKYIDYRLGFGPVILGHSYPSVTNAISKEERRGTIYALDNELELQVSKQIIDMVPCAEMVRFSVTGTEATMHAIRLARGYTKKDIIIKFEGHYHGGHDYLLFSTDPPYDTKIRPYPQSMGIPKSIGKLVIVETFNNFESIERTVKEHHKRVAAIIMEPIMGNASGIMPKEGYLKFIKELCDRYGILLIFDEVKTGFRVARGGAQELYGVTPHIATFAKSMSNGYPISAITGQEEIMRLFGPGKDNVRHGGTYASNPLSLTAAKATLNVLRNRDVYAKINRYGKRLMKGIKEVLEDNNVKSVVQGHPSMFQYICTNNMKRINNYKELHTTYGVDLYSKIQYWLLTKGIMVDEDVQECWYMCLSHDLQKDLSKTLEGFSFAVERAKNSKFKAKRFDLKDGR
ncbi:MAG: aspartate aminotransferase family protein [Candidatus Micrarchaeaceae archaeon]